MKIGFIGGGNMAEAMIKGMVQSSEFGVRSEMRDILVSEPGDERRKYLEQSYGIKTTQSNKKLVSFCNIIILAVKPQNMETVLNEISERVTEEKTVVSIAAGITFAYLSSKLQTRKLIRVMPNTPALVQEGMTIISFPPEADQPLAECKYFSDRDISIVREIFMSIGKVITLPEKYMDVVTALSGSGPAFIALFIEAMINAGIKRGLDKEYAITLTIQTLLGTARLLETGITPQRLREMVTSPGGTTAAGLEVFNRENFGNIVIAAVEAAANRAEELGKNKT